MYAFKTTSKSRLSFSFGAMYPPFILPSHTTSTHWPIPCKTSSSASRGSSGGAAKLKSIFSSYPGPTVPLGFKHVNTLYSARGMLISNCPGLSFLASFILQFPKLMLRLVHRCLSALSTFPSSFRNSKLMTIFLDC